MTDNKDVKGSRFVPPDPAVHKQSVDKKDEQGQFGRHQVKEPVPPLERQVAGKPGRVRTLKTLIQRVVAVFSKAPEGKRAPESYQHQPEPPLSHQETGRISPELALDDIRESLVSFRGQLRQPGPVEGPWGQNHFLFVGLAEIRRALATLEGSTEKGRAEARLEAATDELKVLGSLPDGEERDVMLNAVGARVSEAVNRLVKSLEEEPAGLLTPVLPAFGGADKTRRAYLQKPVYFDAHQGQLKVDDRSVFKRLVARVSPRRYINRSLQNALIQVYGEDLVKDAYGLYFGGQYAHSRKITDRDVAVLLQAVRALQAPGVPLQPGTITMTASDQQVFRFDPQQGALMLLSDEEVMARYRQAEVPAEGVSAQRVELLSALDQPERLAAIRKSLSFPSFCQGLLEYLRSINGGDAYGAESLLDEALERVLGTSQYQGAFTGSQAQQVLWLLTGNAVYKLALARLKDFLADNERILSLPEAAEHYFSQSDGLSPRLREKEGAVPTLPPQKLETSVQDKDFLYACSQELSEQIKSNQEKAQARLKRAQKSGRKPLSGDISEARVGTVLSAQDIEAVVVKAYARQIAPRRMAILQELMEQRQKASTPASRRQNKPTKK